MTDEYLAGIMKGVVLDGSDALISGASIIPATPKKRHIPPEDGLSFQDEVHVKQMKPKDKPLPWHTVQVQRGDDNYWAVVDRAMNPIEYTERQAQQICDMHNGGRIK